MNPWAFLVILVGILLIIVGIKGSQHKIVQVVTGHASTAASGSGNATTQSATQGTTQGSTRTL